MTGSTAFGVVSAWTPGDTHAGRLQHRTVPAGRLRSQRSTAPTSRLVGEPAPGDPGPGRLCRPRRWRSLRPLPGPKSCQLADHQQRSGHAGRHPHAVRADAAGPERARRAGSTPHGALRQRRRRRLDASSFDFMNPVGPKLGLASCGWAARVSTARPASPTPKSGGWESTPKYTFNPADAAAGVRQRRTRPLPLRSRAASKSASTSGSACTYRRASGSPSRRPTTTTAR